MIFLHHIPAGQPHFDKYAVKINGKTADVSVACVSKYPFNQCWPGYQRPLDQTELCGFTSLEADEEVRVEVTNDRDFQEIVIRPLSKNVVPEIHGRTVSFTLKESGQYTVEFDGHHECLTIFNNPVNDFGVSPDDENTLYFGAGVHDAGVITLRDGMTVYIDKDAVVYGRIEGHNVKDARICGYGILDGGKLRRTIHGYPRKYDGTLLTPDCAEIKKQFAEEYYTESTAQIWFGEHITFEGIIIRDPSCFAFMLAKIDGLLIDNIKLIGLWRYNTDGIDLLNSRNAIIENCFVRTFDDAIVLKGITGFHDISLENIDIRHNVVWCDWGASCEIGAETVAPCYNNIVYEDCDMIHGSNAYMRVQLDNGADVHHIRYRHIRCEYTKYQDGNVLQDAPGQTYPTGRDKTPPFTICLWLINRGLFGFEPPIPFENGQIHDILYEDIQIFADDGVDVPLCDIHGLNEAHKIKNITVKNMTVNGKRVTQSDKRLNVGEYTENFIVK